MENFGSFQNVKIYPLYGVSKIIKYFFIRFADVLLWAAECEVEVGPGEVFEFLLSDDHPLRLLFHQGVGQEMKVTVLN